MCVSVRDTAYAYENKKCALPSHIHTRVCVCVCVCVRARARACVCRNAEGKLTCKFGALIKDDRCSNIFEAIVGTLRAGMALRLLAPFSYVTLFV